jgi:hypothetical protein
MRDPKLPFDLRSRVGDQLADVAWHASAGEPAAAGASLTNYFDAFPWDPSYAADPSPAAPPDRPRPRLAVVKSPTDASSRQG